MTKRLTLIIMAILIMALLCSCETPGLSGVPTSPLPSAVPSAEPTPDEPDSSETMSVFSYSEDNEQHKNAYRSFLDENYDALSAACFGGIAGVGFIDLDLDGCVEMLLFDAGASASMGVQFFDVIDGRVECVSANMLSMAEAFGGEHFTRTVVNSNYFDDFRLMKSTDGGQSYFQVVSFNGAADFSYRELIRFGCDNGTLTLTPLAYLHEDCDIDTGEILKTEYKLAGAACTSEEYFAALEHMAKEASDTGLDASGVFAWEKPEYTADKAGLLAMADAALALSDNNLPAA